MGMGRFQQSSSHDQTLPYDWRGFTVCIEKDNVQPSVGRYENLMLPPIDE